LSNGTVVEINPLPNPALDGEKAWDGVYGFVERRDGQVSAFGGTSHMGFNSGFITRVDQVPPRALFAFKPPRNDAEKPDPGLPRLPITHVVDEGDGLLVLSYSDVFRVDPGFTSWKKVATLEINYRWGRPDAVGAYPAVRVVHPPRRAGGAYLFATIGDGYVSLEGPKATARGMPGQLGSSDIVEIKNTSEGSFFFDSGESDESPMCWRLGANGWEIVSLEPPYEPDPQNAKADAEVEKDLETWGQTRVLVSPDGTIFTVSSTGMSPGTRTTARRRAGKTERIGRETSTLHPFGSFFTADGMLWSSSDEKLLKFKNGRWETVARLPPEGSPSGPKPLNQNGPPWLLLDPNRHDLWRFDQGARGGNPGLTSIELREGEKPFLVGDAIPWSEGALLLATDVGLRTYNPTTSKVSRVDLPEPPQPVSVLIRDRRGRLWLAGHDLRREDRRWWGGRDLWLCDPATRPLDTFEDVPGFGRNEVYALAPDPSHDDGVIAALGHRGVAFVRAGQKP
jgi:hypothetical protein